MYASNSRRLECSTQCTHVPDYATVHTKTVSAIMISGSVRLGSGVPDARGTTHAHPRARKRLRTTAQGPTKPGATAHCPHQGRFHLRKHRAGPRPARNETTADEKQRGTARDTTGAPRGGDPYQQTWTAAEPTTTGATEGRWAPTQSLAGYERTHHTRGDSGDRPG